MHQAAAYLQISVKTARCWLSLGKFPVPTLKIGDRRLVPIKLLQAYVSDLIGAASAAASAASAPSPTTTTTPSKRGRGRPRLEGGAV
ncbi:MAG: helix-turn-helix domain-containing protein [Rugosibacter sp.]|nr:helix-turn-helix domain-containing protein [Rugosibacter sp.]